MLSTNHMQGESMSFEELNVPKNHIYLFKPQPCEISFDGVKGITKGRLIWYNIRMDGKLVE